MLIRILAVALIVVGAAGFLLPFWLKGGQNTELPLAEIADAATAADRVFFALTSIGRVQVYSREGAFLYNFPVNNSGGTFCLDATADRLTVAVARRDAADTFDLSGRLLQSNQPINETQYDDACRSDPNIASIDRALTGVSVTFTDGRQPLTVHRQWWHYIALGPLGSWLLFALGILLGNLSRLTRKK